MATRRRVNRGRLSAAVDEVSRCDEIEQLRQSNRDLRQMMEELLQRFPTPENKPVNNEELEGDGFDDFSSTAHISNNSLVNSQLNRINGLESNSVDKVGSCDQVSRGSTYQAGLALCASINKPDQRYIVNDIKLRKGQVGYKVS
ncbi:hypothetical protein LWI29_036698 [Acer saccharum]|uniref:Uncharacterized protein n=1 Tax=Acer saccharum TaxID=4024 RepID=A0AA39W7R2_ACESA|nr:hypothetical protein LWI29_036698 [Acer saccharum]